MNELQVFSNPAFGEIRTIEIDSKPYAVGADIAKALGYAKPQNAISQHCRGALKQGIGVQTGKRADGTPAMQIIEMRVIPEGDIYRLIANSKLPAAEKFERWVFDEVLPTIRKTGGYIPMTSSDNDMTILSKAVLIAQRTIENQKAQISSLTVQNEIMRPKSEYFDALVDRNVNLGIRETAKELRAKERAFTSFLVDRKYLYRDQKGKLMPYAQYVGDLFVIKECINEKTQWGGTQTLITPKGRETLRPIVEGLEACDARHMTVRR